MVCVCALISFLVFTIVRDRNVEHKRRGPRSRSRHVPQVPLLSCRSTRCYSAQGISIAAAAPSSAFPPTPPLLDRVCFPLCRLVLLSKENGSPTLYNDSTRTRSKIEMAITSGFLADHLHVDLERRAIKRKEGSHPNNSGDMLHSWKVGITSFFLRAWALEVSGIQQC